MDQNILDDLDTIYNEWYQIENSRPQLKFNKLEFLFTIIAMTTIYCAISSALRFKYNGTFEITGHELYLLMVLGSI